MFPWFSKLPQSIALPYPGGFSYIILTLILGGSSRNP
jgi:hypothetical protein